LNVGFFRHYSLCLSTFPPERAIEGAPTGKTLVTTASNKNRQAFRSQHVEAKELREELMGVAELLV